MFPVQIFPIACVFLFIYYGIVQILVLEGSFLFVGAKKTDKLKSKCL